MTDAGFTEEGDGRDRPDGPVDGTRAPDADRPILRVRNLKKHYPIDEGVLRSVVGQVRAVDGIDFDLHPGETLGIVGESGCGKSTAARTMLRLEEPTGGEVWFEGEDVTTLDERDLRRFRRRVQLIFQDPTTSFDPRMSIGESLGEPLVVQGLRDRRRVRSIVEDLLERVGLAANDHDRYPHELSGGQKQRIAIARAMILNPDVIVADEPVSALDVSIKAEILSLLESIQEEFGLGLVVISHDMGVVRRVCDRVAVMYLGRIVELAATDDLFDRPQHPYTRALLASMPRPDPHARDRATGLSGTVPSPADPPPGCSFHTRCPEVIQPEGYRFDQRSWRAVMDFRIRLRSDEIDLEALRSVVAARSDATGPTAGGVEVELEAALREELGLDAPLADERAEGILSEAIALVIADERDRAIELLSTEFETPCDIHDPPLEAAGPGHLAACHLVGGAGEGSNERDETTPEARDGPSTR